MGTASVWQQLTSSPSGWRPGPSRTRLQLPHHRCVNHSNICSVATYCECRMLLQLTEKFGGGMENDFSFFWCSTGYDGHFLDPWCSWGHLDRPGLWILEQGAVFTHIDVSFNSEWLTLANKKPNNLNSLIQVNKSLFEEFGVKHRITSAYHPQV